MTLQWVRLDTGMPDNPKVLRLLTEPGGSRAGFVWVCCIAYSGRHGLGGFIGHEALARVNGRTTDMNLLVRHELLHEAEGGWEVHGWAEYQPSDSEVEARRSRAQRAAQARWSRRANGKGLGA